MRSISNPDTLDELERRLRMVQPDSTRRWGTLTPEEMLCHLGDAATKIVGRASEPSTISRPFRKWVALKTWVPWPHGAQTNPQIDPRLEGTHPGNFEGNRDRAISALRALLHVLPGSFPSSHKVFGSMSSTDWLYWAYKHTDHHLRQFGL